MFLSPTFKKITPQSVRNPKGAFFFFWVFRPTPPPTKTRLFGWGGGGSGGGGGRPTQTPVARGGPSETHVFSQNPQNPFSPNRGSWFFFEGLKVGTFALVPWGGGGVGGTSFVFRGFLLVKNPPPPLVWGGGGGRGSNNPPPFWFFPNLLFVPCGGGGGWGVGFWSVSGGCFGVGKGVGLFSSNRGPRGDQTPLVGTVGGVSGTFFPPLVCWFFVPPPPLCFFKKFCFFFLFFFPRGWGFGSPLKNFFFWGFTFCLLFFFSHCTLCLAVKPNPKKKG